MSSPKVVYLKILSWHVAIGGRHFMGELIGAGKTVQLKTTLSKAEARRMNKSDFENYGTPSHWKPGMETEGWNSKLTLIRAARRVWKEHFPQAVVLFQGNPALADPMITLAGPDKFVSVARRLHRQAVETDYWNSNRIPMQKIADQWDALMVEWDLCEQRQPVQAKTI